MKNTIGHNRWEISRTESPGNHTGISWYTRPHDFFRAPLMSGIDTFYLLLPFQNKILTTGDPMLAREVVQNRAFIGGAGLKVLRPIIGERSTIMLTGDEHQERRKIVSKIFSEISVEDKLEFIELFSSNLEKLEIGPELTLYPWLQDLLLRHTVRFLFKGLPAQEAEHLCELIRRFMHALSSPLFIFLKPFQFKFLGQTPWDQFLQNREILHKEIARILNHYKHAALPRLRELRSCITNEEEIAEEIVALILFGHDTTASALSWVLFNVLSRPKIAQELVKTLGAHSTTLIAAEDPLLTGCIAESHRITPTVTQLIRQAIQDTSLAGIPIHRGQNVYVSLVMLNHNQKLHEKPHLFDPLRRSPAPNALQFGAGTRICVGKNLAETQIKMASSIFFARSRFELTRGLSAYRATRNNVITCPGRHLFIRRYCV